MKKFNTILILSVALSFNAIADDFKIDTNPLHYAVSINNDEYVKKLMQEDPQFASEFNKDGQTPVHIAIKNKSLKSLNEIYKENINPNILNAKKESPLIYAIKLKYVPAIKLLLSKNASKELKDLTGKNAIDYAKNSTPEIKELILNEKVKPSGNIDSSAIKELKNAIETKQLEREISIKKEITSIINKNNIQYEDKIQKLTKIIEQKEKQQKLDQIKTKKEYEDKTFIILSNTQLLEDQQKQINKLKETIKEMEEKYLINSYSRVEEEKNPIIEFKNEKKAELQIEKEDEIDLTIKNLNKKEVEKIYKDETSPIIDLK